MMNLERVRRPRGPGRPRELLSAGFGRAPWLHELFDEFLRRRAYDRQFCLRLLAVARQGARVPWEARRLAVLMLEHQLLKLPATDLEEFDLLLTALGLKPAHGAGVPVAASALKEGYTTTELRGFVPEFRRRLERLARVHEGLRGPRSSERALGDFLEMSRRDCRLTLARYAFSPDEVVARVVARLRMTEGVEDLTDGRAAGSEAESLRAAELLPDYEAAVLRGLTASAKVYWASDSTASELNSLVEYPLTTVVVVVKPPGSQLEFEVKRAGRKGAHPLRVVYARGGYTVPPSHRLDGASMLWLLQYEARAAARLARIYRLAHGAEAPLPSYHARTNIFSVPVRGAAVPLISYLTEPRAYGPGFREMRAAMDESVAAFDDEGFENLPVVAGDLGRTAQFISHVTPAQSVLAGTSSFRLDKLACYLSDRGPEAYFRRGLNVAYTKSDARRLADELLDEVLGVYRAPAVAYQSHGQYVAAALDSGENRERADRAYLSLVRQMGRFWGTLLAVRGHSRGESFVARNVGLRTRWEGGRWAVGLVFLDHDALSVPGPHDKNFLAREALPNIALDERYLWGGVNPAQFATSSLGYLQSVYRVGARTRAAGRRAARAALKEAYARTCAALATDPELRRMFSRTFLERHGDWDAFVAGHLRTAGDAAARARWERETEKRLAAKGYRPGAFASLAEAVEKNAAFIGKYSFLFA